MPEINFDFRNAIRSVRIRSVNTISESTIGENTIGSASKALNCCGAHPPVVTGGRLEGRKLKVENCFAKKRGRLRSPASDRGGIHTAKPVPLFY